MYIPGFNSLNSPPAHLIYGLTTRNYKQLRKDLPEARTISEDQLLLKGE